MNDDLTATTSDLLPVREESPNTPLPPEASSSNGDDRRRKRQKKRASFLDDLVRNIDIMIYCQLSVLYYMDCSLSKFLIRALPEWFYFTPKPAIFPPQPTNRPYVGAIFGTNILCLLMHTISSAPEAGEAMRGYLHGGLLIDFVGQEGPISKTKLVLLDILTLALQLLMLSVTLERSKMRDSDIIISASGASTTTTPHQDHDSEERGLLRPDPTIIESIQLQPLPGRTGGDEDAERDELLAEPLPTSLTDPTEHPLDTFSTGEHMIVNLHILDTIRSQWWQYGSLNTTTSDSAAASATGAAAATEGRRIGFRLRIGGRELAVP